MQATELKQQDEQLISRIKQQDKEAFAQLYDNYSGALFGVILRVVQKEAVAEDVLQEAFVKIWKNFKSYDSSKGRLFTWMLNIAKNTAIDKLRSKSYKQEIQIAGDDVYVLDKNSHHETNTDIIGLRENVAKLKPEYKAVIDLTYFGGYTHEEAAEELDLPLGTVKSRIRIAIRELKKLLT